VYLGDLFLNGGRGRERSEGERWREEGKGGAEREEEGRKGEGRVGVRP